MKNFVKRVKTFSLAALLLLLATVTLTQSMSGLRSTLWQVEACVLTAQLIKSKTPEGGDIDLFEDEFADGMQDHWDQPPSKEPIVDLIKRWDPSTYRFGGFFHLTSGERVRFSRPADHESEARQQEIERWSKRDEAKGGIATPVVYQPYDIESPAFPGQVHHLILADGAVRYGNFDYYTKEGWGLVSAEMESILDVDMLNSKAVQLAESWIGAGTTPEGGYFALRTTLIQHKTKVPVLGWEVSSALASTAIALVAIYVAVIFTHTTYGMRDLEADNEEPWLAIPSFSARNWFEFLLRGSLTWFGVTALMLSITFPLVTIVLIHDLIYPIVFWVSISLVSFLTACSLVSVLRMTRSGPIGGRIA